MAKEPKRRRRVAAEREFRLPKDWPWRYRAVKVIHEAPGVCRVVVKAPRALEDIEYPEKLIPVLRD